MRRVVDGARLAVSLFTVVPVSGWCVDRATAAVAMCFAPAIGAVLGAFSGLAAAVALLLGAGPAVAAVAALAVLAGSTRALHLDGLADTADALGSGRTGAAALAVMRRSDIGPFGVVTLVLVLLAQVSAAAELAEKGTGSLVLWLGMAAATGRAAATLGCRSGVTAARSDGLGALVAGTLPPPVAALPGLLLVVLAAGLGAAGPGSPAAAAGVAGGLAAALVLEHRALRRFGGVTGDVLGALLETATTVALVLFSITVPA